MVPPFVTLEEHFFSAAGGRESKDAYTAECKHRPGLVDKLLDLGALRLSDMETGMISIQVISHAPDSTNESQAKEANNQLAEAIKRHPDRFAGFATLPVQDPVASAAELRRSILELGLKGALINNHTPDGTYYDGEEYNVIWQVAEELDVPVYLHPTWATDAQMRTVYEGNYSEAASSSIATASFGWHSDVATHFLKLYAAGVFDRNPKLKIILGHFGEMLPFMLERICIFSRRWGSYKRAFREVWDENVWVTTSGVWSLDPMVTLLRTKNIDRILFSIDYPFATNESGLQWWKELVASHLLTDEDLERIAHGNAERLLGIKAQVLYA